MSDFNQAILLGNLTRDPEFRLTPKGQAVASFSLATNRRWKTNEGQQGEDTQFHNIVAWGKLAEICNKILYKGRKTLVVGRIQTRNWEGQDGVKRYTTEIIADQISAVGNAKTPGEQNITDISPVSKSAESVAATKKTIDNIKENTNDKKQDSGDEINLDDIPF